MLQPLRIPNAYCYSELLAESPYVVNSYLFTSNDGNVLIEPLPLDESTARAVDDLGGLSHVVATTPSRRDAAQHVAARYACEIVDAPRDRQRIAPGMRALSLPNQQRPNEFAVVVEGSRTVVAGDALLGTPAGALSLPDAALYADPVKAALGLRRILREDPAAILTSAGQPLFTDAYKALYEALHARAGAELLRINLDELELLDERAERPEQPPQFTCLDAEVGFAIGARKLGYRVSTLAPGQRFCPLHGHAREEELFVVLDGEPSVRTLSGTLRCRKGDFIALPTGISGTHQLLNDGDGPATVLLLSRNERFEACYYPDSDKLLLDLPEPLVSDREWLLVAASPQLDYFDGER